MVYYDLSFPNPEENILFDEALLSLAEKSVRGEALRCWESPQPFVVLGRIGKIHEDVWIDHVQQDQVPVLRRSSGGGTVVQGKGCLSYALILSKEKHPVIQDLKKSYAYILGKVVEALAPLGHKVQFMPISDLANKEEKKFSGNAQKRGRRFVLHHGTILYQFDLPLIERYLRIPQDIPDYRRDRSHLDFVDNLALIPQEFKNSLCEVLNISNKSSLMRDEEKNELNYLLAEKKVIIDINNLDD